MSLTPELKSRIDSLLASQPVVLFMKGTRAEPRCGFSASAVATLNGLLDDYATVDVLADAEIREGIKAYGSWPTIPQLYVRGELIGGSDIISESADSGELQRLLGLPSPPPCPIPSISISDSAAKAIREALEDADGDGLHLSIDGQYRAQFQLKPAGRRDIVALANGIEVRFDGPSASRAEGLQIDWTETVQGGGLSLHNPNAPPAVRSIDVRQLANELAAGTLTVIDVRPEADRQRAAFAPATVLEPESMAQLAALPKDSRLAFLCHHGNSSRNAAEHFRGLGFRAVYNVEGGIDAWSQQIDSTVPRY